MQMTTVIAFVQMTATSLGAAVHQIFQYALLTVQELVLLLITRPMAAENVRHLDHGANSESVDQLVDGLIDRLPHLLSQVGVEGSGRWRGVAQDRLNDAQIDSRLQ